MVGFGKQSTFRGLILVPDLLCFRLNQKKGLLFYRFQFSVTALIDYNIYRSVMMVWFFDAAWFRLGLKWHLSPRGSNMISLHRSFIAPGGKRPSGCSWVTAPQAVSLYLCLSAWLFASSTKILMIKSHLPQMHLSPPWEAHPHLSPPHLFHSRLGETEQKLWLEKQPVLTDATGPFPHIVWSRGQFVRCTTNKENKVIST